MTPRPTGATMATTTNSVTAAADHGEEEVRLYSHSAILYWWPVWAVGFLMALLTYLEGSRMAVVPPGTEARGDWRVEVEPGRVETREGPLLPGATPGPGPEQPRVWM